MEVSREGAERVNTSRRPKKSAVACIGPTNGRHRRHMALKGENNDHPLAAGNMAVSSLTA
jgi:hypothetical protein